MPHIYLLIIGDFNEYKALTLLYFKCLVSKDVANKCLFVNCSIIRIDFHFTPYGNIIEKFTDT